MRTDRNCMDSFFFCRFVGSRQKIFVFSFIVFNRLQARGKLKISIIKVMAKAYRKDIEAGNKFKNKEKIELKFAI